MKTEAIQTLAQAFIATCERQPGFPALKYKENNRWISLNFSEYKRRVFQVSGSLISWGVNRGDRIALLSLNRPEWVISDMGILCSGAVTVPLYASLKSDQVAFILNQSGCKIVIAENREQYEKIVQCREDLPHLEKIVVIDSLGIDIDENTLSMEKIIHSDGLPEGTSHDAIVNRSRSVIPDDLASIVYTSGTTGQPKGVMLSHKNFMSNIHGLDEIFDIVPEDSVLNFLPLAHVLERTGGYFLGNIYIGAQYIFVESLDKVAENIVEVSPTVFVAVPRLFEKMYTKILGTVESSSKLKKGIFKWSVKTGERYHRALNKGKPGTIITLKHRIAQVLVYRKLQEKLGGRLRLVVSGGAPLEPRIADFFFSINIPIMEGYGLTETSPVTNVNYHGCYRVGSVGQTLSNVEVKTAEDGEILIRGPNVMSGYYKDPDATQEVMTHDGWFKSGDIGKIDADGFLWITDRKKEIIVTSGGKNVAPQPIENILKTNPFINQVMLVGDKRNFVAALIVPEFNQIKEWGRDQDLSSLSNEELVAHPLVIDKLGSEVDGMIHDLPRFEQVKRIILIEDEWLPETGELTPTMKLKRRVILDKYSDRIESAYSELSGDRDGFR
jgi:long-chain acyl-CoA synthetase